MSSISRIQLNGIEYNLLDKEAQQIIQGLTEKIDKLQQDIEELKECLTWKVHN